MHRPPPPPPPVRGGVGASHPNSLPRPHPPPAPLLPAMRPDGHGSRHAPPTHPASPKRDAPSPLQGAVMIAVWMTTVVVVGGLAAVLVRHCMWVIAAEAVFPVHGHVAAAAARRLAREEAWTARQHGRLKRNVCLPTRHESSPAVAAPQPFPPVSDSDAAGVDCAWMDVPLAPVLSIPGPALSVCSYPDRHGNVTVTQLDALATLDALLAEVAGPCTPERPVAVHVGPGLGATTLFLATRGCRVVAIDPSASNLQRLGVAARNASVTDRIIMYRNVVAAHPHVRAVTFVPDVPHRPVVSHGWRGEEGWEWEAALDALLSPASPLSDVPKPRNAVYALPIDDVLDHANQHSGWRGQVTGSGVNMVVVQGDSTSVDGSEAMAGLWSLLAVHRPPFVYVRAWAPWTPCDRIALVRRLYGLGYHLYTSNFDFNLQHVISLLRNQPQWLLDGWFVAE